MWGGGGGTAASPKYCIIYIIRVRWLVVHAIMVIRCMLNLHVGRTFNGGGGGGVGGWCTCPLRTMRLYHSQSNSPLPLQTSRGSRGHGNVPRWAHHGRESHSRSSPLCTLVCAHQFCSSFSAHENRSLHGTSNQYVCACACLCLCVVKSVCPDSAHCLSAWSATKS